MIGKELEHILRRVAARAAPEEAIARDGWAVCAACALLDHHLVLARALEEVLLQMPSPRSRKQMDLWQQAMAVVSEAKKSGAFHPDSGGGATGDQGGLVNEQGFECLICKSRGFSPSVTGRGCTFCNGTEGGHPPEEVERTRFEKWISGPPYEMSVERYPRDEDQSSWPGQYRWPDVQIAWESWRRALGWPI